MIRRVRGDAVWLHGSYRFESREVMRRTLLAAEKLVERSTHARTPLSTTVSVIGTDELLIVVKVSMFEQYELAWALFGWFARCCCESGFEARVDVI